MSLANLYNNLDQDLIDARNTFGIDPQYLLADYNNYFLDTPVEDNNTAMAISNYDELFGPQTFTDALGTTRSTSGSDRPNIYTAPFNVNKGVTNTNSFRSMLLDDLRNSLGQTKDALVEDFSGLTNFAKDKFGKGFDLAKQIPGMAISAAMGVPFVGQGVIAALNALQDVTGPNYRSMIESDLGQKGYVVDDIGRIVQTGKYATPENIMAGYNLASPGITAAAFNRMDKIKEGLKKGIYKNPLVQKEKLNALGKFALEKERARKAAYEKAIQDAKNAERQQRAREKSITAGYGGWDESPGATGPTAAGAGMGVGGGYASDYGFKRGGIVSLYG